MHIESLRVLVDLVETESFSHAARMNHVTQSAVSQKLLALEKKLGIRIVDRHGKGFHLTPEGKCLYNRAKQMLKDYNTLLADVQEFQTQVAGNLSIAATHELGCYVLPRYLRDFFRAFPSVKVRMDFLRPALVYNAVISNIADVGFVSLPQAFEDIEAHTFTEDEMVLISSLHEQRVKDEFINLEGLNSFSWVTLTKEHPLRSWMDRFLSQNALLHKIEAEVNHIELMKLIVETSQNVALVPRSAVQWEYECKHLKVLSIDALSLRIPIAMIRKISRFMTPGVRSLLAILKGDIFLLPQNMRPQIFSKFEKNHECS